GQSGHIGYAAGSDGQAIVAGSGASWATTYNLYAGYEGDGALTVSNGGQVSDEFGFVGTKSTSTGSVTVTGAGSRWVNSNHLFIGTHGHGALTISDGATVESIDGYLGTEAIGGGSALVTGSGSDWAMSGDLYVGGNGSGALTLSDDGTVTVGGGSAYLGLYSGSTGTLYIGAASGDAAVGAGTVEATALTFGAGTGTLVFNHTDADYDFAPDITGAGTISHLAGVTNLTGNNSGFTGTTTVSGGLLNVDGMLGGTLTLAGGSLGGNGTLGTLNVASGTLAPGHSVGTLNVGDLSFDAGSTYAVELNDGGFVAGTNNDFINATGTINITGGTVHVAPENGTDAGETYSTGSYTIATAAGGVSGTFDSITDDYLFLDFTLGYDASNIILTSEQVAAFQNVALTPNQIAAAAAAETLVSGNAVYDALLGVATEEEARAGFDALSGEAYATMASGTLQASRYPREAMLGQDSGSGLNRWASTYGGMMSLGSDGNAAAARAYAGGLIAGIDKGFSTGFGTASNDLGAGIYGGAEMGATGIRFGANYTMHQISSSRQVNIGGFSDHLTASYTGGTAQIFGELSYGFDMAGATITPFAGAAYLYDWTQGFTETGGAAALNVAAK
ncbi:MAG: autotransporter domain-containing protein, partial [Maritimibacter sp.]